MAHNPSSLSWGLARKTQCSTEAQGKENSFHSANCVSIILASAHKEPVAFIFLCDVFMQIPE
jgi:hypothetical protein